MSERIQQHAFDFTKIACTTYGERFMFAKFLTATIAMAAVPAMFFATGTQDPARPNTPEAPRAIATTVPGGQSRVSRWEPVSNGNVDSFPRPTVFGLSSRNSTDQQIQAAAKAMRQAETSSERSQAKEKLMTLLSEDYDSRLSEYEAYLEDLEKRLDEMRAKLKKRRQAKDDMIDLRIKVLEAEADDLGWPARVRQNRTFAFPAPAAPKTPILGRIITDGPLDVDSVPRLYRGQSNPDKGKN